MTGKTHKAIGTAVGAAIAIYGFRHGDPSFTLALVTAPVAAMLPDIDHDGTRIGRMRKQAASITLFVMCVALIGVAWYYSRYLDPEYTAFIAVGLVVPLVVLARRPFRPRRRGHAKRQSFFTKHRGIMHSLLIPACGLAAAMYIEEKYFLILLYAFVAGYLSHILADCFTTKGCPILFPITTKNISLLKITTGTPDEKLAAVILIAMLIVAAFILPLFRI